MGSHSESEVATAPTGRVTSASVDHTSQPSYPMSPLARSQSAESASRRKGAPGLVSPTNSTRPPVRPIQVSTSSNKLDQVAAAAAVATSATTSTTDVPNTVKLLGELERSWAMFSATWKVVDLFAGMQIWQEQTADSSAEPLNGMLLSASSAGLVTFLAGSIGGGGVIVAVLLTALVVLGALWTMTTARVKREIPCFKTLKVIDGTPSEIFLYLMNVKNYPV